MCSKLNKIREAAARRQQWRCFYCDLPMAGPNSPFHRQLADRQGLVVTAEHLLARQDGGGDQQANIAAAHALCNQRRHRRKAPLEPLQFRQLVAKRLGRGGWFSAQDQARLAVGKSQDEDASA
jgi:hypothetical protein